MAIFHVIKGKVEFDSFLGISRSTERVFHCEPLKPDIYHLSHAFWGLYVEIDEEDRVALLLKSLVCEDGHHAGDITFGESTLALAALRAKSEKLATVPVLGSSALTIGPDKKGVTVSLERYRDPKSAPKSLGQDLAEITIRKVIKPNSGGGADTK